MQREIIMAGFGGQGIMLIGQLLAYSALAEGKNTCWLPSYGPEMRGGTANCTVVISDREIGSPIVHSPSATLVMNLPSLQKFGPSVKKGGLVLVNSSLIPESSGRSDVDERRIPANEIAIGFGNGKAANMVLLGAYVGATGVVELDTVKGVLRERFADKPKFIELNLKVLDRGFAIGRSGDKEVTA